MTKRSRLITEVEAEALGLKSDLLKFQRAQDLWRLHVTSTMMTTTTMSQPKQNNTIVRRSNEHTQEKLTTAPPKTGQSLMFLQELNVWR